MTTLKHQSGNIVLASSSVYRRAILERIGLEFCSCSPDIDESPLEHESGIELARRLAAEKAVAVSGDYNDHLIVGSDQVAELNGKLVGKPKDFDDAVAQLTAASGQTMLLHTAVAVFNSNTKKLQQHVEQVLVEYRSFGRKEILRYLELDKPFDCCGSLKVESHGITLLKRIQSSDPNAITGLPVIALLEMLRTEGVEI